MSIRERRVRLKLSQLKLAHCAGVSRFKLCLYELGQGTLSTEEIARLEAAIAREAQRLRYALVELETGAS
jgi:predicted transcriptional regulator